MIHVTLNRYRSGEPAIVEIASAYLNLFSPSANAPEVFAVGQSVKNVTGSVEAHRSTDLKVGDLLLWSAKSRWFQVVQDLPYIHKIKVLVAEFALPLADEFDSYTVPELWWSATVGSDFYVSDTGFYLSDNVYSGTAPSSGSQLTQSVIGNFDVWAAIRGVINGPISVGSRAYLLLGAAASDYMTGAYVGLWIDGGDRQLVHMDEYTFTNLSIVTTDTVAAAEWAYVRLKRTGSIFRSFVSPVSPVFDRDWIEVSPVSGMIFESADAVSVGFAWFESVAGTNQIPQFDFIRNWKGQ